MDRRIFISTLTGALLGSRLTAAAQTGTQVRRIGVLADGAQPNPPDIQIAYRPLRELGWIEGKNLLVERRYTNGKSELLTPLAQELVRLKVEIIVTHGTLATLVAKNATTTIPIVMRSAGDPVRTGLVASMARPGGNITGYSIVGPELDQKRLEMLLEVVPTVRHVAWLEKSDNPYYRAVRKELEKGCRSLGIEPIFIPVDTASELGSAVAEVVRQRGQGLIVPGDGLFYDNRTEIMRNALTHKLPTMVEYKSVLRAGALVCYSDTQAELNKRFAAFIDKILRGAKPADLPIEQPTKFELAFNLKTAKDLGITIPQTLLVLADDVIR